MKALEEVPNSTASRVFYTITVMAWMAVGSVSAASSFYYATRVDAFDAHWMATMPSTTSTVSLFRESTLVLRVMNFFVAGDCAAILITMLLFALAGRARCHGVECACYSLYWVFVVCASLVQTGVTAAGVMELRIRQTFIAEFQAQLSESWDNDNTLSVSLAEYSALIDTALTMWCGAEICVIIALLLEGWLTALRERSSESRIKTYRYELKRVAAIASQNISVVHTAQSTTKTSSPTFAESTQHRRKHKNNATTSKPSAPPLYPTHDEQEEYGEKDEVEMGTVQSSTYRRDDGLTGRIRRMGRRGNSSVSKH
jgi:hypothetical protein